VIARRGDIQEIAMTILMLSTKNADLRQYAGARTAKVGRRIDAMFKLIGDALTLESE
jgi:hypothetical protein